MIQAVYILTHIQQLSVTQAAVSRRYSLPNTRSCKTSKFQTSKRDIMATVVQDKLPTPLKPYLANEKYIVSF
jgi:hypothetical protein